MSKIKFNIEWYKDNKVAIACRTKEESEMLHKELQKLKIDDTYNISLFFHNYLNKTCYDLTCRKENFKYEMFYSSVKHYVKEGYTIINFSDLEFESDIVKNEPKITKTENEECGYDLPVEVDKSDKNHILRGNVKLNSGDIIHVRYKELHKNGLTGIITSNGILYTEGLFDSLSCIQSTIINKELEWYIPSKDIKDESLLVSQLLFKGELKDRLKDLIIYVEDDKPKKVETRIYHISVSENRSEYRSFCISNNPTIEIGDIVSIDKGLYSGRYGIVISTKYEEISEEDIKKHYSNITKIK